MVVGETAILKIVGRVDFRNSHTITQKGMEALEITSKLLVDLKQTTFLDSTGIGALVGLAKRARDAGGELKLAAVPESIMKVLAMLRLDQFFEFVQRVEDGLGFTQRSASTSHVRMGKWRVYRVPRQFDADTSPMISRVCADLLAEDCQLILDFTDTVFLGSAGLATLLNLNRLALQGGGVVRIASCSDDVSQVIKMVRFDKVLSIYPDVKAATSAQL